MEQGSISQVENLSCPSLKKGGTGVKVPLFKGDLGGSRMFCYQEEDFSNILLKVMEKEINIYFDSAALANHRASMRSVYLIRPYFNPLDLSMGLLSTPEAIS